MVVVKRSVWHVSKLLASFAPHGKAEGVYLECWPVVAGSHHLGGKGAFFGVETANSFMKFFHDLVCLMLFRHFSKNDFNPLLNSSSSRMT